MKHFSNLLMVVLIFSATIMLFSCGETTTSTDSTDQTEQKSDMKNGPEYTSAYICPMHCEGSGSATPGKCPVCGMDYVAKAELDKKNDHDGHDHDHDGHEH